MDFVWNIHVEFVDFSVGYFTDDRCVWLSYQMKADFDLISNETRFRVDCIIRIQHWIEKFRIPNGLGRFSVSNALLCATAKWLARGDWERFTIMKCSILTWHRTLIMKCPLHLLRFDSSKTYSNAEGMSSKSPWSSRLNVLLVIPVQSGIRCMQYGKPLAANGRNSCELKLKR